jgi:catechol 2,3-dioxygenase-like lactoylglutathione lyase family enzyme
VFTLPDGRNVEVFDQDRPGKDHFDTGPVGGFAVADLPAAVAELRAAGIELLGEPGPTWQHFRGPDGNVYELVAADPSV